MPLPYLNRLDQHHSSARPDSGKAAKDFSEYRAISYSTNYRRFPPVPKNTVPIQPRMLGITAAASYVGATEWYIRTLIWERKIAFVRLGKRLLIDRSDLDSFLDLQKVGAR